MPETKSVVTCPHCGHPYPMSAVQLEVYRGRHMGCMNCGRPFTVGREPEEQAEADVADIRAPAASVPDTPASTVATEAAPSHAAAPGPGAPAPAVTLRPRANLPALLSFICGCAFFALLAISTIAGWATGEAGASTASPAEGAAGGLLLAAVVAAALAVGLGTWGLLGSRRRYAATGLAADGSTVFVRPTGKGLAIAGLALGGGGLLVTGCLGALLMPMIHKAREESHRNICLANLQQISSALQAYAANDPARLYPDTLAAVIDFSGAPAGTLPTPHHAVCPGSRDTPAKGATPALAAADFSAGGHLSYVYLGRSHRAFGASANLVLAYEPLGHHAEGAHVLFADGTIVFCDKVQAAQIQAELGVQNPPASASLIRQ